MVIVRVHYDATVHFNTHLFLLSGCCIFFIVIFCTCYFFEVITTAYLNIPIYIIYSLFLRHIILLLKILYSHILMIC